MDINEWLIELTGNIDGFMYTYILLILLVVTGVYFTIRTKCVQIRYLKDMFRQVTEKKHVDGEKSISSFRAVLALEISRALLPQLPWAVRAQFSGCGSWLS